MSFIRIEIDRRRATSKLSHVAGGRAAALAQRVPPAERGRGGRARGARAAITRGASRQLGLGDLKDCIDSIASGKITSLAMCEVCVPVAVRKIM